MPIYKIDSKKDGKQGYRVIVSYVDMLGKYKKIERRTHGLAEAKNLEKELAHSLKENTQSQSITVQALFDEYLEVKKHELRESSLDESKNVIERYILPHLGKVKLSKLTLPVLQKWKLSIEDRTIERNGQKLSLSMKQTIYSKFRALLNYAVNMEYVSRNPLTKLGNFKSSMESKKEMDYYTSEEFLKFINVARECAKEAEKAGNISEWHYYIFFMLAFYTGLRKGEINALQWDDIDGEYLSVNKSVVQKLKGGDRITPPKNKSSIRTLQIPAPLLRELNSHKERCKQIEGFSEECKVCGGLKALRDTSLQNRSIKFSNLAGVKKIRIHDFRHSHASLLANNGINIQEIARRLGHSKVEMTWNTYSHLYPKEEERAICVLNKIE